MSKVLPKTFFDRDTRAVAQDLLGARLVRDHGDERSTHVITEVEAYDGPEDKACHAYLRRGRGRQAYKGRTQRTEVMFGEAGHFYVYLVYGMHNMLNVVTGPKGYPAAVLVRGVEEINGPGRLTRALDITRELNKRPVTKATGLWLEEGSEVPKNEIVTTPRVGINYAEEWVDVPYRFVWQKENGS